jgi:type IV secretory pathway VirD2 relaxase
LISIKNKSLILTGNDTIIVKNRFFKSASAKKGGSKATGTKLTRHFKYLEHRPKDERDEQRETDQRETREDRYIFNQESDHVPRREAVSDVMEHTSNRVAYHHLILSPDPKEPVTDMKAWTRDIMSDFERQQGKELHWYAVQHSNTDHPHVHVVLAGAGEVEGQEKYAPVTIFNKELDELHRSALEHSDHALYQQLDQMHLYDLHELDQEQTITRQNGFER